jgi:hypothetical protein
MKMEDARRALVAVDGSVALPRRATVVSLELPENLTEAEWLELLGRRLHRIERSVLWWVGDWWAFGERKYAERKRLVDSADWDGPSFETCMDAAWVARQFQTSDRSEVVSWTAHRVLAAVRNPDERHALLRQAEAERWSVRETKAQVRSRRPAPHLAKLSDSWNFGDLAFPRLESNQEDPLGYIPGDLYANVLFHFSGPGDVVVAPVAGSGMIFRVYEDRARWMGDEPWDLDVRGADLNPRGECKDRIAQRDALEGIEGPADLIIADIPYFGLCENLYSDKAADLGNMGLAQYDDALVRLARSCRQAQPPGGRTVIIVAAAYVDLKAWRRELIMLRVADAFRRAGYEAVDAAFATRRIQQEQTVKMARTNRQARERRVMLSEISVIFCFEATDRSSGLAELLAAWVKTTDEQRATFVADHAPELRRLLDGPQP